MTPRNQDRVLWTGMAVMAGALAVTLISVSGLLWAWQAPVSSIGAGMAGAAYLVLMGQVVLSGWRG